MAEPSTVTATTYSSTTIRGTEAPQPLQPSIYSFSLADAENKLIDFKQFENKVVVIVNVASLCGFTPQYRELQQLYSKFHSQGFEILGFPCNQFGNQEPKSDKKVVSQCRRDYGVEFRIMKKVKVNGEDQSPLYQFLKNEKSGMFGFKGVRWNFEKFIIDRKGKVVARFDSWINPMQLEKLIESLLRGEK
ncbi:hypothetical protein KGF57_003246 [Candida theae]|uniref:Glutathione peroxidase n=1 Tax=Candida theae TaxID=1198502 RepID=A0AAD5BDH5_9ASCO|nr:uncharacterized protein KGF57_003246 [Candida theae]KAI5957552.1 hypothetical protein KGF57_003246 [Candida theae]